MKYRRVIRQGRCDDVSRHRHPHLKARSPSACTDDEMLLVWRKPDEAADAAVLAANKHGLFGSSDLVLCASWYAASKPPAARWHRRFPADLSDIELDYCHRTLG